MKLTLPYTYIEGIIPPRCRKPRPQEFEAKIDLTIREVTSAEAPTAIIQHTEGWRDKKEVPAGAKGRTCDDSIWVKFDVVYRWYKGQLYVKDRIQRSCNAPHEYQTVDQFAKDPYPYHLDRDTRACYAFLYSKQGARCGLMAWARTLLFIDGERWIRASEPRYVVMTFGLGHNHGGSALMTENHYNGNISKDCYYRIDQFDAAMKEFERVALGRGDTESVPSTHHDTFEILIPEAIRIQPSKEAGPGDPFLNKIEGIVSGVKDPLIAGLAILGEALR